MKYYFLRKVLFKTHDRCTTLIAVRAETARKAVRDMELETGEVYVVEATCETLEIRS